MATTTGRILKLVNANIVSCFAPKSVGTKVLDREGFEAAAVAAIEAYDFAAQRVPGQGSVECPAAIPFVSAGVGKRTKNPEDYVLKEYRGNVETFLRREHAAPVEGCALVVYTASAYLADPDVVNEPEEAARIVESGATHVLVAVLAFAGPKAPLSPYRLVHNLAGGNNEALQWSADEIRAKALESKTYHDEWCTVAD